MKNVNSAENVRLAMASNVIPFPARIAERRQSSWRAIYIGGVLVPLTAAALVQGCSSPKHSAEVPNFGSAAKVVGEAHPVKQIKVIQCSRFLTQAALINPGDGYRNIALRAGATNENIADFTAVAQALDPSPERLTVDDKIFMVDLSGCNVNKPIDATHKTVSSITDAVKHNRFSAAIYGTNGEFGGDTAAMAMSDTVRFLIVGQP